MKHLTIAQWVGAAIGAKQISQAELSRLLQAELRRSYDRSMVYKMIKGERDVSAAEIFAIERITGHPVPSQIRPEFMQVPLLTWPLVAALAAAGAKIPREGADLLPFADLGDGEFFALRVDDDSMDRVSPQGSVILVNRADRALKPNRFYVLAARGQLAYRRWQETPPRLEPLSTNHDHEPTFLNRRKDVTVIGRVRRTLLDL